MCQSGLVRNKSGTFPGAPAAPPPPQPPPGKKEAFTAGVVAGWRPPKPEQCPIEGPGAGRGPLPAPAPLNGPFVGQTRAGRYPATSGEAAAAGLPGSPAGRREGPGAREGSPGASG